ncbi:uncharacterized protein LOC144876770 [Branchiostoma floridae x Branchiostoma japonicum]
MDVLLINCDKTYPLDSVETLLKHAISNQTTQIEKQYCKVSELQAVSEEVRQRRLLFGVFVVNAYESRLSINEENAGIGYAVLYRALLEAAQGRIVVVIGGDDRYKDGEQNKSVLSTWAYHKVAAQFDDTYLDGRRGFVFSWDERHNPVHEEALDGYLRAITTGQPGLEQPFKPRVPPPSEKQTTRNLATTSEGLTKEGPTQNVAHGDRNAIEAASISQRQKHKGNDCPDQTRRTVGEQNDKEKANESQRHLGAREDEHATMLSSTNVEESGPLGAASCQTCPPHATHNERPHPTTNKEHTPEQSCLQPYSTTQSLPFLSEEYESKLAKYLKEKIESDKKGRIVKLLQIFVNGQSKSRYDYPKDADVFCIPDYIQEDIRKSKGRERVVVVVVFDDGPRKGQQKAELGVKFRSLADIIEEFAQLLRGKIEIDNKGRIVKVIQIFVDGNLASHYDYSGGVDVFPIPAAIQSGIDEKKGEGRVVIVVIFDDGPRKELGTADLGLRFLSLDDLMEHY